MDMTEHANHIKQMEQAGQDPAGELEKLYFDNLAFVRQIAKPFEARQEPDDLLQEGYISLIRAFAYYDPNKGAGFSTIWGLFLRSTFARMNDSRPYIPHHTREDMRKYKKLEREYIKAQGKEPPAEYFAEHFTARELEAVNLALLQEDIIYLDAPQTESGGTLAEVIPDPKGSTAEDIAIEEHTAEELRKIWEVVEEVTTPEQAAALKAIYIDGQATKASPEINRGYKSGLARLQKNRERFAPFMELLIDGFVYSEGVKRCGVSAFNEDGQSATERAAFRLMEREKALEREAARLMDLIKSPDYWDLEKYKQSRREHREKMKQRFKQL